MGSGSEYNIEPTQSPERSPSKPAGAVSYKPAAAGTAGPASGHVRVADLLAFLGVLIFVGGLTLLIDPVGQLPARLAFAGAAGLVVACMTAWRRLQRPSPRRWRSGQVIYRGRKVTLVTAWGVEGQPLPVIELSEVPKATAESGSSQNLTSNEATPGEIGDASPAYGS